MNHLFFGGGAFGRIKEREGRKLLVQSGFFLGNSEVIHNSLSLVVTSQRLYSTQIVDIGENPLGFLLNF